jgi:hypothetical protein
MKKNNKIIVIILAVGLLSVAGILFLLWNNQRPHEGDLKELSRQCAARDSVTGLVLYLSGFNYNEVATVGVKELNNDKMIDSFFIRADRHSSDSLRKYYSAPVGRSLKLKNTYQFFISGQKPYVLSNMTIVLRRHPTMTTINYGCDMYAYRLNGQSFEGGNPVLIKE